MPKNTAEFFIKLPLDRIANPDYSQKASFALMTALMKLPDSWEDVNAFGVSVVYARKNILHFAQYIINNDDKNFDTNKLEQALISLPRDIANLTREARIEHLANKKRKP